MKLKTTIAFFSVVALALMAPLDIAWGQTKDVDELVTNQRLKQMDSYLALKEEQKEKIRPLILEEVKAIKKVREQENLTMEQKFAKEDEIRKQCMAKVKPVMTPEQYAKWEERLSSLNKGRKKK
jgi:Spy/CpxP family protein refolding chaperone